LIFDLYWGNVKNYKLVTLSTLLVGYMRDVNYYEAWQILICQTETVAMFVTADTLSQNLPGGTEENHEIP
jgi:hypothetical protein